MVAIRYVNDLGNGHSGYIDAISGIPVSTISGQPLSVTAKPEGAAGDAFGRQRVSEPLTLFDSSHRFSVNGNWNTATAVSGTATFNADQGLIDLDVVTTSGSYVYRETNKVFPYQPGKSLLVMTSFVMASGDTNLRQRVGYFGANKAYTSSSQGIRTELLNDQV